MGFPRGSVVKNPPANAGDIRDTGLIPGSGRSPGAVQSLQSCSACLHCVTLVVPKSRGGTEAHGDSDQRRTAVLVFSLAGQTEPPGMAECPEPSGNRVPLVLLPKQSPHPAGCKKDGGRETEGEEGKNKGGTPATSPTLPQPAPSRARTLEAGWGSQRPLQILYPPPTS